MEWVGFRSDSRYPGIANWRDRIEVKPEVPTGKRVVRGTRLAVKPFPKLLALGETESDLLPDPEQLAD